MPNQYTGPSPLLDRLWSHIDRSGGPEACWPWTAATNNVGYGQIWHAGKTYRAHRLLEEVLHGSLPPGIAVLHRCDNRLCCNPSHLFRGTLSENTQDMVAKGRQRKDYTHHNLPRGEQHHNAHLSDDVVRQLRQRYVPGICTCSHLAREFGLPRSTVRWVVLGNGWRHLPRDP